MQMLRVTVEISDDGCDADGEPKTFNPTPWTAQWQQTAEMENVDEKEAAFLARIMAQSITSADDKVEQLVAHMRAGKAAAQKEQDHPGQN